ncbi:MAG: hypothetical protein M3022_08145 [Actinomycetota bacterium]|nr:hypothetical protein [Actinomycetota bacterium]
MGDIAVLAVRFVAAGLGSTPKIDVEASALLTPAATARPTAVAAGQLNDAGSRPVATAR